MKPKHVDAYRNDARATLRMLRIAVGQKFSTLGTKQVMALHREAFRARFQPLDPTRRAERYFERLQRRAK